MSGAVATIRRDGTECLPGLALVALGVLAATVINAAVSSVFRLVIAVVIGAMFGNFGLAAPATSPAVTFAGKRLLRVGVVLLGLRLSISQITDLGPMTLSVIFFSVFATFFGTQWLWRRMGLSNGLCLLVGTGFGTCGLSAIAAVGRPRGRRRFRQDPPARPSPPGAGCRVLDRHRDALTRRSPPDDLTTRHLRPETTPLSSKFQP